MSSKFYEVQDNITLSYHAYSPLVVAMNLAKFNELSPEFQEALLLLRARRRDVSA